MPTRQDLPPIPDAKLIELWRRATHGMGGPRVQNTTGVTRSVHQRLVSGETRNPTEETRAAMVAYLLKAGFITEAGEVREPWDYAGSAGDVLIRNFRLLVASSRRVPVIAGKLTYADLAAWLQATAEEEKLDPTSMANVLEYCAELLRLHAAEEGDPNNPEEHAHARSARAGAGSR